MLSHKNLTSRIKFKRTALTRKKLSDKAHRIGGNPVLRTIFCGNLTKAISLVEIDVTFKVIFISANETDLLRFPRKIFLQRKLGFIQPYSRRNPGCISSFYILFLPRIQRHQKYIFIVSFYQKFHADTCMFKVNNEALDNRVEFAQCQTLFSEAYLEPCQTSVIEGFLRKQLKAKSR